MTLVIESDASVVRKCCSSPEPHELPGGNIITVDAKRFRRVDNISDWLAQKAWKANMKPEKLVLFFHVGHSVTVPATGRQCNLCCATDHHSLFLLFSFTNEVLVQRDLMWYWKATAAYKTDAYILPKLLGEKVALPLAPPCAQFGAHRPYTGALCFSILRSVRRNFTFQQNSNMVPVKVLPLVNFPSRAIPEMFHSVCRSFIPECQHCPLRLNASARFFVSQTFDRSREQHVPLLTRGAFCMFICQSSVVVWAHLASAAKHPGSSQPEFIGVDRGVCSAGGDGWHEDKCRRDTSGGPGNRSTCSVQVKLLCRILWWTTKSLFFLKLLRPCVRLATRPQVLYRRHHLQKRSSTLVFSIHFLFCQPVSCGVYDDLNGAASPPDHIYTIATCNTGHTKRRPSRRLDLFGFTWFGWKLVVHFCVVCTYIF